MTGTLRIKVNSPAQTQRLGEVLAAFVRPGDLLMLAGGLGAGKTTFTQGLGAGMGVRGRISSPTFIIAREHRGEDGPALVHADAYRIGDLDDLETLDLESSLEEAVTVVEWGQGKTESLSADRLEIEITRPSAAAELLAGGDVVDLAQADDESRTITLRPASARWELAEIAVAVQQAGLELLP